MERNPNLTVQVEFPVEPRRGGVIEQNSVDEKLDGVELVQPTNLVPLAVVQSSASTYSSR